MSLPPNAARGGFLLKTFSPPGEGTKWGMWPRRWVKLTWVRGGHLALAWSPSEGKPPTGHLVVTMQTTVEVVGSNQLRIETPGESAPAGTLLLQAPSTKSRDDWRKDINTTIEKTRCTETTADDVEEDAPIVTETEPVARALQRWKAARIAIQRCVGPRYAELLIFLALDAALGLLCAAAYGYPESDGRVLQITSIVSLLCMLVEIPAAISESREFVASFASNDSGSSCLEAFFKIIFLPFVIILMPFITALIVASRAIYGIFLFFLGLGYYCVGKITILVAPMLSDDGEDPGPLIVGLVTPPIILAVVYVLVYVVAHDALDRAARAHRKAAGAELV